MRLPRLVYFIDGPATGHSRFIREEDRVVDITVHADDLALGPPDMCERNSGYKVYRYHLQLTGIRAWPFIKIGYFMTCQPDRTPDPNKLDTVLQIAPWLMDEQPSFLQDFNRWWVWMRSKLWLEENEYDSALYGRFVADNKLTPYHR